MTEEFVHPLVQFLLKRWNKQDLDEIDPFEGLSEVKCWEPARDVMIKHTFAGPGPSLVTPDRVAQPRHPFEDRVYDTDKVTTTSIFVTYARSKGSAYHVQTNFVPVAFKEATEARDRATEAAGGIARHVMNIPAGTDKAQSEYVMHSSPNSFYLNEGFTKTMAFINPKNLLNGIIDIPDELFQICAELPDEKGPLPRHAEVTDAEGQPAVLDIKGYVLVPANHILAWKLVVNDHWRRAKGYYALNMSVSPREDTRVSYKLYYIVCDHTFNRLMNEVCLTWIGKVDQRPITEVGFNFIPQVAGSTEPVEVDVTINYTCFPQMDDAMIQSLIPTLHPNFLPYEQVLKNTQDQ